MTLQLKKVGVDLVQGRGRSLLVVFALVLGLWGLGSILVSERILSPDLRENFLRTAPPHAIVTLPGTELPVLGPEVEAYEYRDFAILRIEVHPQEWIPLLLYGVDDLEGARVARVRPQAGAYNPPPGAMVVERNSLAISDLALGTPAHLRQGPRNLDLAVAGVVFDAAQAPATQDHFVYGYADKATWAATTGEPSGRRLLLRLRNVNSSADVQAVLAKMTLPAGSKVQVPPFQEHPHQWQLNLLLGIIGAVGLLSFLLSSVLVAQVMAALLAREVRQIGILKAIGATNLRIVGFYALYLLAFAVVSGALGVPLAVLTGTAFSHFVAGILNFDVLTREVPFDTWALLVAAALLLPFLFAAPTLVGAGRLSVRRALSDAGVGKPDLRLAKGWRPLRNLARRPRRTLTTMVALALGVAIFATGFNMRESLAAFLKQTRDAMRFDLQVVLTESVEPERLTEAFAHVEGVQKTELWSGGRGELQSRVSNTDSGLGIVALPATSTMFAPHLLAGRWLKPSPVPEVVTNQAGLLALGNPPLGRPLRLPIAGQERSLLLVGVVEEIDKAKLYLDQPVWQAWQGHTRVNTLSIVASDASYAGVMALKQRLEKAVVDSSLSVLYVMSQAERTKIIADHLDIVLATLLFLALLVLGVSALGSAAATSITVRERTREIGVLRAIGATPRQIVGQFVAEGLTTSALGLALGLAVSWPLSLVASAFFGNLMLGEGAVLRFAWSPLGSLITVGVTLLFGWWSSRAPARGALALSTRQALAYE